MAAFKFEFEMNLKDTLELHQGPFPDEEGEGYVQRANISGIQLK